MTRNPAGRARVLLLALLASVGCTRDAARQQHTLIVAYGADDFPLAFNRERLGRYPLNAGICEPLVRLTREFAVAPALAARWEHLDSNAVRFQLRPRTRFSDGATVTAAAVAGTLAQLTRARVDYSSLSDSSVRVLDDSTFDILPARINRRLVEQLVHPMYGIIEPGSDPARRPVCTGPFQLVDYVAHDYLTVARNDRYRGPRPPLDTLVFRFIPDELARTVALRSGQVHAIVDVGRANATSLARQPGLTVVAAPMGAVIVLYMNLNGTGPYAQLRDTSLRRAVAMAIDRQSLVRHVLGHASSAVVSTINPPAVMGADAALVRGVAFDTAEARRRMQGRRRSLSMIAAPSSIDRATVEYVQAQLARIGIDVRFESLDAAAYESRLNTGAFDLDLELPNQNDANPAFLLALRWYSRSSVRSARYMHASPRFDALVERALAANTHAESRHAAAQAMHQLVDVEVAAVPLAGVSRIYAMSSRVRGFLPHPSRLNQDWSSVWLAP